MNVLLAIDGSDAAWDAIQWLESWPSLRGPTLHVIAVIPPWMPSLAPHANGWVPPSTAEQWLEESRQATQSTLRTAVTHLRGVGFDVVSHLRQGEPLTAITNFARDLPADLLITGRSHTSRWQRWITGSVSLGLLSDWPGPLILVPAQPKSPHHRSQHPQPRPWA